MEKGVFLWPVGGFSMELHPFFRIIFVWMEGTLVEGYFCPVPF
jgi:hypothetical protein